jgi:transposase
MENNIELVKKRYKILSGMLNEKSRRLWSAAEAKVLGFGGISIVSKATKISRTTISTGIKEVDSPEGLSMERLRKEGGGRKKATKKYPEVIVELERLLEPYVRGEPESPLLWTSKSLRKLSEELKTKGFNVSHKLVGEILKKQGFSLQANRKTYEGKGHPDRDEQFNYIHQKVVHFQSENNPVISVDAKKKELVGNFKNNGREWQKEKEPVRVNAYDFLSIAEGKAIPYGVYDINQNKGWVNIGIDRDTAEFAVESIRRWWFKMGSMVYPKAKKLLITADSGGSNGARNKLWKREIQKLSSELQIEIHICHFPPSTSKWNKIEHRLFSYISQNWRGKPLISYELIINLISSTKTTTGLEIKCDIDTNSYEKGIKVSDEEMNQINIEKDDFHGDWNYKIKPK